MRSAALIALLRPVIAASTLANAAMAPPITLPMAVNPATMPLLTPAAVRSIDFMDFSARWVSVTNDPVFINRSMTMEPAVAMRSASRGFQAERREGSQVGIGELMGNRSRLQEVEVLLD